MKRTAPRRPLPTSRALAKAPTGIAGLDEITEGGLPKGRASLICGGPGCGKTLLAMEFLVHGASKYGEPGVFMTFEENQEDLAQNFASLGFDLGRLCAEQKLALDYVRIERAEIEETGAYDLEGLFIRLGHAIDTIGARRVVLDTIEALFASLPNEGILRAELRRLFGWLKKRGVTAVITGERGHGALTRQGLEEYVADCVIVLDHRLTNQISTRRLRVVKYRGSLHGTNEYPFLIDRTGVSVLPVTSLSLDHPAPLARISSGLPRLDTMLGGKGYYRGSSILVSGTAGSGKTSLAAAFADAACRRGETCLFFAFEESPRQIIRNMRSVGFDLGRRMREGRLHFHALRPSLYGLEMHLVSMTELIRRIKPSVVVIDPISNLVAVGETVEVRSMLVRMIDCLKNQGITSLFTDLTSAENAAERTDVGVSSLMDAWLLVRNLESSGERNRGLFILKSRGMAHSNQIREFRLTNHGIELADVYIGSGTVLTGSARRAEEAREASQRVAAQQKIARLTRTIRRKQELTEAQVKALKAGLETEVDELSQSIQEELMLDQRANRDRRAMARQRMADKQVRLQPANNRPQPSNAR